MKPIFDSTIHEILNERLSHLETYFKADVLFYFGPITDTLDKPFRDLIEELRSTNGSPNSLYIILNTPGGSAETVERLVKITRHH
jgi:ATP-dependent protease ClpP protease subunit